LARVPACRNKRISLGEMATFFIHMENSDLIVDFIFNVEKKQDVSEIFDDV